MTIDPTWYYEVTREPADPIPNGQWGRELWLACALLALHAAGDELQQMYYEDGRQARDAHTAAVRNYDHMYRTLINEHAAFKAYLAGHHDLVAVCDALHTRHDETIRAIQRVHDELRKLEEDLY